MEHLCGAHLPPSSLHGVRLGMSAQAMQRLGHWCPSATPGTQLRRARVSYLWCDHPGGRPCPAGAIYLIYLLRLLPPNSHLLQAPGVYRTVKGGCSVHRTLPASCTWSRSPAHKSVGGRTCTVANLREVGDPATLGTFVLGGWVLNY